MKTIATVDKVVKLAKAYIALHNILMKTKTFN